MKKTLRWGLSVFFCGALAAFLVSGSRDCREYLDPSLRSDSAAIRILVDPRIELMSIVFRLAGNREYNMGAVPAYIRAVDTRFGSFKKHTAVKRARNLRRSRGMGYNAPMSLAVYLTPPPELEERASLDPLPHRIDGRWSPDAARAFLDDLRAFVRDTGFETFFTEHHNLYQTTAERLRQMIREARILDWFDGFYGRRGGADFIIVLGMLNGGASYGASTRLPGTSGEAEVVEEIYSVLGVWSVDEDGLPQFSEGIAATIVHEFAHSYINPLVDAHAEILKPSGEKLFAMVESRMRKQAYGTWQTVMYESLVRACGVRYTLAIVGPDAAEREIALNRARGFAWTGALSELLEDYEKNRATYPTLDAFMPRFADFFDTYIESGRAAEDVAALGKETR